MHFKVTVMNFYVHNVTTLGFSVYCGCNMNWEVAPWVALTVNPSSRQSGETVVMRGLLLILKSNCIRQPKRQLPSSCYNHNTLKTLTWLQLVCSNCTRDS